jgi:hypothetical protein
VPHFSFSRCLLPVRSWWRKAAGIRIAVGLCRPWLSCLIMLESCWFSVRPGVFLSFFLFLLLGVFVCLYV